ncbi:hypothetical protein VTO73DRAFT_7169 [Trametes versicolor]
MATRAAEEPEHTIPVSATREQTRATASSDTDAKRSAKVSKWSRRTFKPERMCGLSRRVFKPTDSIWE